MYKYPDEGAYMVLGSDVVRRGVQVGPAVTLPRILLDGQCSVGAHSIDSIRSPYDTVPIPSTQLHVAVYYWRVEQQNASSA